MNSQHPLGLWSVLALALFAVLTTSAPTRAALNAPVWTGPQTAVLSWRSFIDAPLGYTVQDAAGRVVCRIDALVLAGSHTCIDDQAQPGTVYTLREQLQPFGAIWTDSAPLGPSLVWQYLPVVNL